MTFTKGPTIVFTYEEVQDLVLQLTADEKIKIAKALEKAGVAYDWDAIFTAIKPNQVSEREILRVGKAVRAKRQARLRREAAKDRR